MDLNAVDNKRKSDDGEPLPLKNEVWHLVKSVPKILGFIGGTQERPAPITEKEAQAILQHIEEGTSKPRPKVLFEVGESVRVTEGPFTDFSGMVEEIHYEKNRLTVAVRILGRPTPVELASVGWVKCRVGRAQRYEVSGAKPTTTSKISS